MQTARPESGDSDSDLAARHSARRGRARQRQLARQSRKIDSTPRLPHGSLEIGRPDFSALNRLLPQAEVWIRSITDNLGDLNISRQDLRKKAPLLIGGFIALVILLSLGVNYVSGGILPGVSVAGIGLAGLSAEDAVAALRERWAERTITLRDGQRSWALSPAELGFSIDLEASVQRALQYGREQGGLGAMLGAALSGINLQPVVDLDTGRMQSSLLRVAAEADVRPRNATLRMQGAVVTSMPAAPGRRVNVSGLALALVAAPTTVIQSGAIDLPIEEIQPLVADASPLVSYAQSLLQNPLSLDAYDPITDVTYTMNIPPAEWGQWLDTQLVEHPTGPRLYLSVLSARVRDYLETQTDTLPDPMTINLSEGIHKLQRAVADGSLKTWVQVHYEPVVHTIARGETAYGISRSSGIPFYLIQQSNPDRDLSALYPGDQIALPSRDLLLPLPPVLNKRIVVDLSDQYLWAYEDGRVVYEWSISSGIRSAPTNTGVFQILSHSELAYGSSYTLCDADSCGQWKMHYFMGIYEAVPGLMNGFHGAVELPNGRYLGGGQVGQPFTYGCIMSQADNAELLYNWAEEGVIVEIRD